MVFNTSYKMCLQNVETDYLEQCGPTTGLRATSCPRIKF